MSVLVYIVNTKAVYTLHLKSTHYSSAANYTFYRHISVCLLHCLSMAKKGFIVPRKYESALTISCNWNDCPEDGASVFSRNIRQVF